MFLISSCSCLCPIHWSQVLSLEWRCSWSSADRRCSNYIWVINNFITYQGTSYIRGFTVLNSPLNVAFPSRVTSKSGNIFWLGVILQVPGALSWTSWLSRRVCRAPCAFWTMSSASCLACTWHKVRSKNSRREVRLGVIWKQGKTV